MDETTRLRVRGEAEQQCDHEAKWVSNTEPGYTAEACWACLLDAYFDQEPNDA